MFDKKKVKPYLVALLIGAFIGGGFGVGCANLAGNETPQSHTLNLKTPDIGNISASRMTPAVVAAQKAGPAVVGITNKAVVRDWFTNRSELVEKGTGSGVVIDAKGYIVTNNHVIEGAKEIVVSFADGTTVEGKLIGSDPVTDLAVVKVDVKNLPVAELGDSDALIVGEPAVAIGNPLGLEFQGSVTSGVVSALNRSLDVGDRKFKLIQTDAAINPGNSGGALVNADGQVIGINTVKLVVKGVEGMGFAIPINSVRPIVEDLVAKGRIARAYMGINVLEKEQALQAGYPYEIEKGVVVVNIGDGTPAANVGMRRGDVIIRLGQHDINKFSDLRQALDAHRAGDHVKIDIIRAGQPMTIDIVLGEVPVKK
ncbi:MAG: trypsin-like peptidase domain-containing protein [Selenomonadales bacterium]|nr:trypsin-like peptidase domain-containing protein [Selenomonadales bacterium]